MHILVTNDDGPPSPHSSPYILTLVRQLEKAGHTISVVLPHTQRSWVGKAHIIGQTVKPLYYRPPVGDHTVGDEPQGSTYNRPSTTSVDEWVLVDGTPASCVQIGLYHFFQDKGPVDLVVSGPNYGRNTTAVFALSSGTLGGALEAAICTKKSIAVSFAFFSRNHDPEIISAACRHSVRVIEALYKQWPNDKSIDLYSVNVPLVEGVEEHKTFWTSMLQNYWSVGGCFQEVEGSIGDQQEEEERIREGVGGEVDAAGPGGAAVEGRVGHTHKHFKWAPRFGDVYKSVEEAGPGNDGWAVKEGQTSVTPLKANFFQAGQHLHDKELVLETISTSTKDTGGGDSTRPPRKIHAIIAYEDEYVQPLILSALKSVLSDDEVTYHPLTTVWSPELSADPSITAANLDSDALILQISPYEAIDFDYAMQHPSTYLINSYMLRKALIRKHYLANTILNWTAKRPDSVLKKHFRRSESFEVDYAEFLDDSLVEAFDLRHSLEKNVSAGPDGGLLGPEEREWWILKPGMSDRGLGIRLFSTMEELQGVFDGWEVDMPDSDEDEDIRSDASGGGGGDGEPTRSLGDGIMASHLRHFVAQPYIHPPMLVPGDSRKFHIRTYVVCVGSLRVWVYRQMLVLFARKAYRAPWECGGDVERFLTNTCLQTELDQVQDQGQQEDGSGSKDRNNNSGSSKESLVSSFWETSLSPQDKESIFAQICAITGELFEAAAEGMMMHFQPLPSAFEVFGLDFLVGGGGGVELLECNSFPDFKQTGEGLRGLVEGLWRGVVGVGVVPFLGDRGDGGDGTGGGNKGGYGGENMVLVKEMDLGRRFAM